MSLSTPRSRTRLRARVAVACAATALLAGACGSNADNTGAPSGGSTGNGPQTSQDGPAGQFPGAIGKVAAVADDTAQVQGMQGQVAVTWTGSTTFTKEVSARLADVKVGSCVAVSSADETTSGSTTPPSAITAGTVRITQPTNGSCAGGGRGPGSGPAGPQVNGTPPSGAPSGGGRPQIRAIGGAFGEVTAVSGTGFTVSSVAPGSNDKTTVTVTAAAATTYTTTAPGAASDVKVGVCVQAEGTTDDTGAVTAKTVAVSTPKDGECGGFVRMRSGSGSDAGSDTGQES
jgi:hypothetical protein